MCCSWYWTWQHCFKLGLFTHGMSLRWVQVSLCWFSVFVSECLLAIAGRIYRCIRKWTLALDSVCDISPTVPILNRLFPQHEDAWNAFSAGSVVFLCISPSFCIYDLSHTYTVAGNGNALHCNLVLLKMNFPSPSPFSVTVLLCHNWLLSSLLYMIFILIEDGHQSDHQQHQQHQQHHHQHYQQNQEDVWDAFCAEDERAPDAKIEKPSVCFEIWILMHETNKFVGHFSQLIPIVCTCFFLVQNNRNNMGQVETQWQPAAATNIQYIKQASNHARKHCRNCQFGCKSLWEEDRAVERL